jgi:monomeric isocitrate dehydrogenase
MKNGDFYGSEKSITIDATDVKLNSVGKDGNTTVLKQARRLSQEK